MSELVKRLLATAEIVESYSDTPMAGRTIREAADRIEALERDKSNLYVRLLYARREALEEAARIADRGMLYGTDGGSPTEDEIAVAKRIAAAIRKLMEPGDG
jgi:hypothetical protein